jgi:hypothetical protein
MEERGGEIWKDLKMRTDESIDCLKTEKGILSDPHCYNHFRKLGQAGPKLDEECSDDGLDAGVTAKGIDVMGNQFLRRNLK